MHFVNLVYTNWTIIVIHCLHLKQMKKLSLNIFMHFTRYNAHECSELLVYPVHVKALLYYIK